MLLRARVGARSLRPWLASLRCHKTLTDKEKKRIEVAVRKKSLEAIAAGKLEDGKELELISALDLGTVPWDQVPLWLKQLLALPSKDHGIDSLSLDCKVAVQAKDYASGRNVSLKELTNFHFMVRADGSPLKDMVKRMVVATNEDNKVPRLWQDWSGAEHRKYTSEEKKAWRETAKLEEPDEEHPKVRRKDLERWDHQVKCFKSCQDFLKQQSHRDFFVQMATGSGKSLVMADLLLNMLNLGEGQRACIIVPTLDLMEQVATLLEETGLAPSRVGTGKHPDWEAKIFVCVQNSARKLSKLNFDLIILDEAHHYEPNIRNPGSLARTVLSLHSPKRIFFSATLRRNQPDVEFGLRTAIQAGVIKDYTVMVPVVTAGDPKPSLVQLIEDLPLRRKILAFCNTVREAEAFTRLLSEAGIAADHYNGATKTRLRQEVLKNFQRRGGIRVLVTVDVISEGVDLPVADTCLFVEPRNGIRLQQCVGRVLRDHADKISALVIAPPVVQEADGRLMEDAQLYRLLSELATVDPVFKESLDDRQSGLAQHRVSIATPRNRGVSDSILEDAAKMLEVRVFQNVLASWRGLDRWEVGFQELVSYKAAHGDALVPFQHRTESDFNLGRWVQTQRAAKRQGDLSDERTSRLDRLGFVWEVRSRPGWSHRFRQLREFKAKHGALSMPRTYRTKDDWSLQWWMVEQRRAKRKGRLSEEKIGRLDELGFEWQRRNGWTHGFKELEAYAREHGDICVPQRYQTAGGFKLGKWVDNRREEKRKGRLCRRRIGLLDSLGFVWKARRGPRANAK